MAFDARRAVEIKNGAEPRNFDPVNSVVTLDLAPSLSDTAQKKVWEKQKSIGIAESFAREERERRMANEAIYGIPLSIDPSVADKGTKQTVIGGIQAIPEDNIPIGEQRNIWEKQAPIGMVEAWFKADRLTGPAAFKRPGGKETGIPTGFIPFNPDTFIKSVNLIATTRRLARDNYAKTTEGELQKATDQKNVTNFFLKAEEERIRGYTVGGRVTQILTNLPAFMIEFAATGGLAGLTQKGITKLGKKALGEIAEKKAVSLGLKSVGFVSRGIARASFQPHRVAQNFAERRVSNQFELTEEGAQILKESREKPFTSAWKAFGDLVIENISEESGQALSAGAGAIVNKLVPRKMAGALTKAFRKLKPGGEVGELLTKAGYNGILEEMGEERLGDLMRAVTGVQNFGEDNIFDSIVASIPDGEQLLSEAIAFSVPGAAGVVVGTINIKGKEIAVQKKLVSMGLTKTEAKDFVSEAVRMQDNQEAIKEGKTPPVETLETVRVGDVDVPVEKVEGLEIPPAEPVIEVTAEELTGLPNRKAVQAKLEDIFGKETDLEKIDEGELPETALSILANKFQADLETASVEGNTAEVKSIIAQIKAELPSAIEEAGLEAEITEETPLNRLDKLDSEIKQLARERSKLEKQTEGLVKDSVKEKSIKRQIENLQKREAFAEAEKTELLTEEKEEIEIARTVRKEAIAPKPKVVKVPEVKKEEVTGLQKTIQQAREKFKTEPAQTKAEIKAVQNELIKQLETSDLDANDKAKFIRAIKNIQTQQQLEKKFPEIEARIITLETKAQVRKIKAQIRKSLKVTKLKKVAGLPRGKFTPEIQEVFDTLSGALKLNQATAAERLANNLLKDDPSPIEALENKMLAMVSGQQALTPTELNDILGDITVLAEGGKGIARLKLIRERTQRKGERITSLKSIVGRKTPSTSRIIKATDKLIISLKSLGKSILGWDNNMNLLAIDDKVAPGQSALEKIANVSRTEDNEKRINRIAFEDVMRRAKKAFKFTTEKQIINKFRSDTKIESLGIFKNERGEEVNFELSRAEARKLWMELQDPSLIETFFEENGNAYTEPMLKAVQDFLTQEDKDFALEQLEFYRNFYDKINKVYADKFGVNLPFNEFYSPISREHKDITIIDEFLNEINFRRSVTTGSLKSRVGNIRPIKLQSDISVLGRHIIEMSHFIAWSDKISQLNNIFTDNEIKDTIVKKFGPEMLKTINKHIADYIRGDVDRTSNYKVIDRFRINFTRSILALKPSQFVKQMVSFPAYWDAVPTTSFIAGLADFAIHPIQSTEILNQAEFMKNRGQNITRDIRDAMKSEEWAAFKKNPSFFNSLMFMTKFGDRGAIVFGGWSVYRHARKQGKSHQEALNIFSDISSATQQSADLSQLSQFQRGNSYQKLFTMFTSSQNQYYRKEYMAVRNLIAGKQSVTKTAKTLFIYHILLPMLFQWVSDFGKWNKKEQLRAALLGSLNGIFILGDGLNAMIRQLFGLPRFKATIPLLSVRDEITDAIGKIKINDISNEDVIEAVKGLEEVAGFATGLPLQQLNNWLEGVKDIQEDEPEIGALKLLGWSPYIIEKNLGEEERVR